MSTETTNINIDINSHEFAYAYYDESYENDLLGIHHHTQNEMVFVKEGQCTFDISGNKYLVQKNQILLINALENHATNIVSTPYKRYVFVSSMELCSQYQNDPILASAFIHSSKQPEAISLTPELADIIEIRFKTLITESTHHQPKWKERCSWILFDILLLLYRNYPERFIQESTSKNLNLIFSIKEYIDQYYYDPLDLDFISKKFFINKYYLSHQFKDLVGYGFKRYLQLIRINKAKILLQTTNLSVNEICSNIGYDNMNYFIRLFKEKENLTPYQYRKMSYKKDSLNGHSDI